MSGAGCRVRQVGSAVDVPGESSNEKQGAGLLDTCGMEVGPVWGQPA